MTLRLNQIVAGMTGALLPLILVAGCGGYGPFEPEEISYYTYESSNPNLVGDCGWLTDALGCEGSACTIVGTHGEMELGLNDGGDEVRIDMRGEDSPEWITLYGPTDGQTFTASYSVEESAQGVSSTVDMDLSGDAISGEISGDMIVDMTIEGYGESLACTIEAEFMALPTDDW